MQGILFLLSGQRVTTWDAATWRKQSASFATAWTTPLLQQIYG
jgi:hypothetical protein